MGSKRLGLIVNPVAGLGGRVGLKGSDGAQIQKRAVELGAVPRASERASQAMAKLCSVENLEIISCPHEMGEDAARACGLALTIIGEPKTGTTNAEDTRQAARQMRELGVDLLLFAGGDGTARDIHEAVGLDVPVLGIPAGVKIHSAVYATNPGSAGALAALYLKGRVTGLREAEVMDIDEDAVRRGIVSARLYGYLRIPHRTSLVQNLKIASVGESGSLASIAFDVVEKMEKDCLYVIGPGTTTRAIADELELAKTLIGVDAVLNGQLIAADVNEAQLLQLLDEYRAKIIVTPIGGQGYIFGRGNQQISPDVIRRVIAESGNPWDSLVVVSTPSKLHALGGQPLLVDTGDPYVDEVLSGYVRVVTGFNERAVRKVAY